MKSSERTKNDVSKQPTTALPWSIDRSKSTFIAGIKSTEFIGAAIHAYCYGHPLLPRLLYRANGAPYRIYFLIYLSSFQWSFNENKIPQQSRVDHDTEFCQSCRIMTNLVFFLEKNLQPMRFQF